MNTLPDRSLPSTKKLKNGLAESYNSKFAPSRPTRGRKKSSRSQLIDDFWSKVIKKVGPCANILMALENTIKMSADRIRLSANALIAFFPYA